MDIISSVTVWFLVQLAFVGFDHVNEISYCFLFRTWYLLEMSLDSLKQKLEKINNLR